MQSCHASCRAGTAPRPRRRPGRAAALAAGAASAKTLVFCSEGSPENFYPGVNTTGTSFDANSQIYSRIVDFERGGTTVVPGLAERWDDLARRHGLHLLPAQGRQVAQPPRLQADARLQRRRHDLRDRAAVEGNQPVLQGHEPEPLVLQRHGHAQAAEVGGQGRRLHGQDHARDSPRRRSCRTWRWNTPASSRRNTPTRCSRPARPRRSTRSRSAPARSTWCSTRRTRSSATRPSRSTGAARPRSTTWCSRSRRTPRCAGPSCRRASAT